VASAPPFSWRTDAAVPPFADDKPLIVFDGECVLCSGGAQFVLRHDRARRFRLTTAQGPLGRALYRHFGLRDDEEGTMLLLSEGRLLTESSAILAIAQGLGGPWRAAALVAALPRGLRDRVYRFVARRRLRWFGRRDTCWMPSAADADRLL
jgi:salicylate hydroxylase